MKQTNQSIPYISIGAAILFAAFALVACAGSGGTKSTDQTAGATTNGLVPACKSAIDDVTLYCSGDKANTGKCNDAKGRTREYCIDQN